MIETLNSQARTDRLFRKWVDALLGAGRPIHRGWIIDSEGVAFTNYGDGTPGTIHDQVMLGTDPTFGSNVVKIVRPLVSQGAKGRQTLVGRNARGELLLLREGCLKKNRLSRPVKTDFAALSGLVPVHVTAGGQLSDRDWHIVARLDDPADAIIAQTIAFTKACLQARIKAGGGDPKLTEAKGYGWAMDEKGGVHLTTRTGGTKEIIRFHNYVYEALKAELGDLIGKPTRNGYEADGLVTGAGLLIEIKTGTFAHSIYEAVGQLSLYPKLLGFHAPSRALLIPDEPGLSQTMKDALDGVGIEVFTYTLDKTRKRPRISFPAALLDRCRARQARRTRAA